MEQHSIPRQITSFEFKLIGFLTLKQFIYLVVFVPIAFIMLKLFPIPLLNYVVAFFVLLLGLGLAFIPINDRPMDVWIKNFVKRLTSPTQYVYQKLNQPIYFLKNLVFLDDPHRVLTHIESQEKLSAYMSQKNKTGQQVSGLINNAQKQNVHLLLHTPSANMIPKKTPSLPSSLPPAGGSSSPQTAPPLTTTQSKQPFFTGIIKNNKLIPLPGVLIYVKDQKKGEVLRLLKTNPHGVFATFNPLPVNEYIFEIKDPKNTYFFDTMKIKIEQNNIQSLEFLSKELM